MLNRCSTICDRFPGCRKHMFIPMEKLPKQQSTSLPQRRVRSRDNVLQMVRQGLAHPPPPPAEPGPQEPPKQPTPELSLPQMRIEFMIDAGCQVISSGQQSGFTINTPADQEEASTSVRPTTTPYSSVKPLDGSTREQDPGRTPEADRTEIGATISLSGGSTTEVFKNTFTLGVSLCWCKPRQAQSTLGPREEKNTAAQSRLHPVVPAEISSPTSTPEYCQHVEPHLTQQSRS